MASADLKVLADSVIKAAGLGEAFDERNTAHAAHLQEFAKKAQETCVANWHRATHVEKVASRAAVREAYGTLSRLEKWAAVLEKTARLSPAQAQQKVAALPPHLEEPLFQYALANDPTSRAEYMARRRELYPLTLAGAITGGLAAGVPLYRTVGPAAGLGGAVAGTLAAGYFADSAAARAAKRQVLDSALARAAHYSALQPEPPRLTSG
jgi:hypothetical protein